MRKNFHNICIFSVIFGVVLPLIFIGAEVLSQSEMPEVPSAPQLTSPCNGVTVSLTPVLRWKAVSGVELYQWEIVGFGSYQTPYTSVDLAKFKADDGRLLINLEAGQSYIWRARSFKGGVYGDWSDPSCWFNTKKAPASGAPKSRGLGVGIECPGTSDCPAGAVCIENPLCAESLAQLLDAIIDFIFWVGITLAPAMLIIAGFLYVKSLGDPQRIETAKKMMLYTLIGLVVLLFARGLVAVLKSILGA